MMGKCSAMSRITLSSSPFSSATRRVKLSLKSISPRMALAVMAFTSSPTPARMASSSMHSVSISVESMSKHINRRQRRYMLSSCSDMSKPSSLLKRINSLCMCLRSASVPRTENSMHDLRLFSSTSSSGMRPVNRLMASMFIPSAATTPLTTEICRAVILRPSMVIM